MKRNVITAMIAGALLIGGSLLQSSAIAGGGRIEKAAVQFTEPVKLLDVILKGDYLFVHDEDRMARGEDCTYIYSHTGGKQGKLVTSFHCIPVERQKADSFTVILSGHDTATGLSEMVEYRFAGSIEGHKVPLTHAP